MAGRLAGRVQPPETKRFFLELFVKQLPAQCRVTGVACRFPLSTADWSFIVNKYTRRSSTEGGESQMGLLIGALVIGGLFAAASALHGFIYNTKEERTLRVKTATYELNKPKHNGPPRRPFEGRDYQVTY